MFSRVVGSDALSRDPRQLHISDPIYAALRHLPVFVAHVDRNLQYTWVQNPYPELCALGITGKGDDERVDNPGIRALVEAKRQVLDTGIGTRCTIGFPQADSTRYFDITIDLLRNDAGETMGLTMIGLDVTEHARTTHELAESEERYRLAAGATSDVIWDWDLVEDTIMWNQAVSHNFGWEEALPGTSGNWWKDRIHPEDRVKVVSSIHDVIDGTGDRWLAEYRFLRKGNTYAPVLDRGYMLRDPEGNPLRMVGAMLDLSRLREQEVALRESREDLKRAQAIAHVGSWRLHVNKNELRWSDEAYRIFGIPEGTPLTYETFIEAVHPDDRAFVDRKWTDALGGEPYDIDHRIIVGGEIKWVREQAQLERGVDGTLLGGFGTVQDITERKRMEDELRELNETLEQRIAERTATIRQRNQELQQFAFVASHDLQEPLRKVQMFASLMKLEYGNDLDEIANAYLEKMQTAASHMSELLRDMLSFSRLETHKQPFRKVRVDEAVQEILQVLDLSIETVDAQVEVFADVTIEADPNQLRQLLNHLVMNALKFQPQGNRPCIRITAMEEPDLGGGDLCRVIVADNGIGFDMKYAERIFEPFQRLHGRSEYPGTGMGLAICRRLVERHGGTIRAESKPGEGSRFIIELPARQESAS